MNKVNTLIVATVLLFPTLASMPLALPPQNDLLTALHNPNLSQQNKYRIKINPFLYDYFQFIKQNTPSNAVIQIPPQANPWPFTGNGGFMRFFLYPRVLTGHSRSNPQLVPQSEYILLAWGETNFSTASSGYPYFKVPVEKITYFLPSEKPPVSSLIFDSNDPQFRGNWGIIKIAR